MILKNFVTTPTTVRVFKSRQNGSVTGSTSTGRKRLGQLSMSPRFQALFSAASFGTESASPGRPDHHVRASFLSHGNDRGDSRGPSPRSDHSVHHEREQLRPSRVHRYQHPPQARLKKQTNSDTRSLEKAVDVGGMPALVEIQESIEKRHQDLIHPTVFRP